MGANSHINYALRKNGKQAITPIHPELAEPLAEILAPTYGLIVYQEQVMEIPQKLAGYSLGRADLLRRAMGKKKREVLEAEKEGFSEGMRANGYSQRAVDTLWEILVPFSDYAFNKSHTAGYGLVSYWTAYLKANYPAQYMAALLSSVKDDKDKMALYLNECRRMQIQVLPPDVNESAGDVHPGRTATSASASPPIRNVGANVVGEIVRGPRREGSVHRLQRLHGQGPGPGLQQAGHRVADQGRRVRRDEAQAAGAGGDPRDGRRPVRRHQAQRGHRPGLAVRGPRRRGGRRRSASR